jgi:putative phage-type endonuclease
VKAKVLVDSKAGREAWLEARRSGIGSSDAPRILGVSPSGSAISVYAEKLLDPEQEQEQDQAEPLRWGHLLEPLILQRAAQEIGGVAREAGQLYQSAERPWQLATLDGWMADGKGPPAPCEAKLVAARAADWSEGLPPYVGAQVQHQLAVLGAPRAYVAALIVVPSFRFQLHIVDRDDAFLAETLLPAEEELWQRVQEKRPPTSHTSRYELAALRRLWTSKEGKVARLSYADGQFVTALEQARAAKKAAQEEEDAAAAELLLLLADAEIGVLPDGRKITAKTQERKAYTVKATTSRPLRIVGGGSDE